MKTAKEKTGQPVKSGAASVASKAAPQESAGPSPAVLFVGGGIVGLGVAVYAGFLYGAPGVVLTLAAVSLVLVIASFWTSIRMLIGETKLSAADAYAIGAQHTELEQKRAVLRALKDLEFERAVGKISEEDYRHLVARFRAEAKSLLQVIDEKSKAKRERAEKVVGAHLKKKGVEVARPEQKKETQGVAFEPIEEKADAEVSEALAEKEAPADEVSTSAKIDAEVSSDEADADASSEKVDAEASSDEAKSEASSDEAKDEPEASADEEKSR